MYLTLSLIYGHPYLASFHIFAICFTLKPSTQSTDKTAPEISTSEQCFTCHYNQNPRPRHTQEEMKNYESTTKIVIWIVIGLVIPSIIYDWMRLNLDPDPARPPIPESELKHNFLNLNKYGNDTSGCPVMPNHFIRVSSPCYYEVGNR